MAPLPFSPTPVSSSLRRQRDGRMENKVADGAIGMRPSSSIFKSLPLAKRAGGRRVFLSRRKITHCPLSAVPRPPLSLLPAAAVVPLVRSSRSTTARRDLLFPPFSGPFSFSPSSARTLFPCPRDRWRLSEEKRRCGW